MSANGFPEFSPEVPQRTWTLNQSGLKLYMAEWGDPRAQPLLLVHGAMDAHSSFDDLAPRLAARGWRVVAYDQRGHGRSDRSVHYGWQADLADLKAVLKTIGGAGRMHVVGHSKGGALLNAALRQWPERFRAVVNLDGLSFTYQAQPQVIAEKRLTLLQAWVEQQATPRAPKRKPSLEAMVAARARANPRLEPHVLSHLVTQLTECTPHGWCWRHDPALPLRSLGAHPGDWLLVDWSTVRVPMLGIYAGVREPLAWPISFAQLQSAQPDSATLVHWGDVGHFVHLEAPARTADAVLEFFSLHHDR